MACSICLVGLAEVAMVPCGHVCVCGVCRDALCREQGAVAHLCPVCAQPVQTTLKVYFAGMPMEAPFSQQPAAACVKEVQFAKPMPSGIVLALTDAKCAEQSKMEEVQIIEVWAAQWPDPQELPLADAMRLMELTVSQETHELLAAGRETDYAQAILSECRRLWRAMAFRLHPDKSTKAAAEFWSETDRLERLQEAFKYCANLRDHVQKSFGAYLIKRGLRCPHQLLADRCQRPLSSSLLRG